MRDFLALWIACLTASLGGACASDESARPDGASTQDGGAAVDSGADASPAQEDAGTMDAGWVAPFEPARCGAPAYSWLDPNTMGKVVKYEPIPEYSLDKKSIEDLLIQQGFPGIVAKYGIKLYRYRYETQDHGQKVEATAVLSVPDLEGAEATLPYVLWLHGTSGWSDRCAPSRLIEWIMADGLMATQGWIGVAPDYVGMSGLGDPSTVKNPYMVGEPTAIASWDAVRAAENLLGRVRSGITPDGRVIAWGGSQGGHAALFAERYAPHYAPEYDVIAALALIPPANLVEDMIEGFAADGPEIQYRAAFTTALVRWYGYEDRLGELLNAGPPNDFTQLVPEAMEAGCTMDFEPWGVTGATDVFTQSFASAFLSRDWATLDPWYCLYAENSVELCSVPRKSSTPFLWVVGENDELVAPRLARQSYDALCAAGYEMDYLECKGADHVEAGMWSMEEQIKWATERFEGKPPAGPCVRGKPVCCSGADIEGCAEK